MVTASQDPGDMARVKMLGADDCLSKPMDLAGFARIGLAVGDWLHKKAGGVDVQKDADGQHP